jgi:hypothetical protein
MADPPPPAPPSPEIQSAQILQNALSAPIMRLYANGFMVAQTASDLIVVMLSNGGPAAVLNMSVISAKSLLVDLQKAIGEFETMTGREVPTIEEMSKLIQQHKGQADVILGR